VLKHIALLASLFPILYAQSQSSIIDVPDAPIPIRILKQSPADTNTDLQVICLFRSSPQNTLHGALIETNEKLNGLLDRIRKPELFRGDLGETLLLVPPKRTPAHASCYSSDWETQKRFLRSGCSWLERSFIPRPAASVRRNRFSRPP